MDFFKINCTIYLIFNFGKNRDSIMKNIFNKIFEYFREKLYNVLFIKLALRAVCYSLFV